MFPAPVTCEGLCKRTVFIMRRKAKRAPSASGSCGRRGQKSWSAGSINMIMPGCGRRRANRSAAFHCLFHLCHVRDCRSPVRHCERRLFATDATAVPGPLQGSRPPTTQGNPLVTDKRAHLRRTCRDSCLGLAAAWLDGDLLGRFSLFAVLVARFNRCLSAAPWRVVLLDPSLDAPAGGLSPDARNPSRQPPTNGLDRDELSSLGILDRRGSHPRPGFYYSHPLRGVADRPGGHDRHGRHQPHGLGNLSKVNCRGAPRALDHHSEPSPAAPRKISVQFRPLFPFLGQGLRHGPRAGLVR